MTAAPSPKMTQPNGGGGFSRPGRCVRSVPNSRIRKFGRPTKSTSIRPRAKPSSENASVNDATSGKIDRNRMTTTVGQMNTHRAAASERQPPPSERIARRWRRGPRVTSGVVTPRGSRSSGLPLDAKAVLVGLELCVAAHLVGDLVPAVGDLLHRLLRTQLTGNVLRDGRVEDVLLVFLGLGDSHVEDHVRVLEAGLDRAEVVVRGLIAHADGRPDVPGLEVRRPVWIETGLAEGHVLARLG